MAISTFHTATRAIGLQEFIDYVDENIDMADVDSVVSAAPMLEALAGNKQMLIDVYNGDLKRYCDGSSGAAYSPSSAVLGAGRKAPFVVRANLWPALGGNAGARTIEEHIFSYDLAHDHNFDFLTANYFGPGYETELWEYETMAPGSASVGEAVKLRFLERTRLHSGKQIFYRRCKDVHIQFPPESFSASINLMCPNDRDMVTDQFTLELENRTVTGFPGGCPTSRRVHLVEIAGMLGDANTADVLDTLARQHPCDRTRAAALDGLFNLRGPGFAPDAAVLSDRSSPVARVLRSRGLEALA